MQTRNRARAAVSDLNTSLPCIPSTVQLLLLHQILSNYPEPDTVEYTLYPFKSTLGWLLSLRLVNQQWNQHVQQHETIMRRCRLESLRNLSLLHDYAHYIVTARASKKERMRAVPKKLSLRFRDASITFAVPRGLTKAEKSGGLPSNTLMLVASCDQLGISSFVELLADVDCLDQRHAAPVVVKLHITSSTDSAVVGSSNVACSTPAGAMSAPQHTFSTSSAEAATTATMEAATSVVHAVSSVQQLIAAAKPLLQNSLPHVVMEGTEASRALYFIPTKHGFCRRVKA